MRDRFISGEADSRADESLIELLLTYAIPQKDVRPLARRLLSEYGSLAAVLSAPIEALSKVDGIKENSAVLLKLVDWIRLHHGGKQTVRESEKPASQATLFDVPSGKKAEQAPAKKKTVSKKDTPHRGTEMFTNAVLKEAVAVRQVMDGGQPWRPDAKAEVLFLGDSFANIFSLAPMGWGEGAGLAEHLSLALGLPVDTITRNDAGSFATREMLAKELQRGNDRLAGKKLVIWEFASRELSFGDWKMLSLALGEKREAGMYVPAGGKTVAVRGVVRAASPAPKPGTVPYKDHIIMVHLDDLESADDPAAAGQEAVVFAWSMRDNVQTPAARWRPGDTVKLRLRPWADLDGKYEAINRSELEDDELLLAEPAWGEL